MSKRLLILVSILLLSLFLVSCGGSTSNGTGSSGSASSKPERSRVLNYTFGAKIGGLNIFRNNGPMEIIGHEFNFDALFYSDHSGGEYRPMLATSWESDPEGYWWIFHLREGVKWHDGEPFTADDVVYTYNHLKELGSESNVFITYMPVLDRAEKIDDFTVKIYFTQPYPLAKTGFRCVYIIQEKLHRQLGDDAYFLPENIVGTGSWILTEWIDGQYVHFVKNPDRWDKEYDSYFDEVYYWQLNEPSSIVAAMISGDIDLYAPQGGISGDFVPLFDQAKDRIDIQVIETSMIQFMTLQMTDGKPFSNQYLREAASLAVNRQEIIDNIWGLGQLPKGYLHPSVPGATLNPDYARYDPERAAQLVAEYYDGTPLHIIGSAVHMRAEDVSLALADYLTKVGFVVGEVYNGEGTTATTRRRDGDYDIFLSSVAIPDGLPSRHWNTLLSDTSGTDNKDEVLFGYIREFNQQMDEARRLELTGLITDRIMEVYAPHVVIGTSDVYYAIEKGIVGHEFFADGMTNMSWISYDPSLVQ